MYLSCLKASGQMRSITFVYVKTDHNNLTSEYSLEYIQFSGKRKGWLRFLCRYQEFEEIMEENISFKGYINWLGRFNDIGSNWIWLRKMWSLELIFFLKMKIKFSFEFSKMKSISSNVGEINFSVRIRKYSRKQTKRKKNRKTTPIWLFLANIIIKTKPKIFLNVENKKNSYYEHLLVNVKGKKNFLKKNIKRN